MRNDLPCCARAPLIHFIGFKGDEYHRACRVFGKPDFIHRFYDARCKAEIQPCDVAIFANGEEHAARIHAFDDSAHH